MRKAAPSTLRAVDRCLWCGRKCGDVRVCSSYCADLERLYQEETVGDLAADLLREARRRAVGSLD